MKRFLAALVLALSAAGPVLADEVAAAVDPLPLPSLDGKPLAAGPDRRTFRVPLRFQRVLRFFRERFDGVEDVTLRLEGVEGSRSLTIASRRPGDAWAKAVVREAEVDTVVEVTPVLRLEAEKVEGTGLPLVELVITRSGDSAKAADEIDHSGREAGK
jgi:hypothetical protein